MGVFRQFWRATRPLTRTRWQRSRNCVVPRRLLSRPSMEHNNVNVYRSLGFVLVAALYLSTSHVASAIPPVYVSDVQLADIPNVVVAKWTGEARDGQASVEVIRGVKGNVQLGRHWIRLGPAIGWDNGGAIQSCTSSMMTGDVSDVSKLALWFLELRQNESKVDVKEYHLDTKRGDQPQ